MVTLVLLPGMDGTGALLAPFVAALAAEFDVKVVSYPAREPLGYSELRSLVRAALPEEGPFVLLGESFSGPIAVSLAASSPTRLVGLVLCCSFVRNPRPVCSAFGSLVEVLPIAHAPMGVLSRFLLGRSSDAVLRQALARALAQVSPAVFRARLRAVLSVDVSSDLAGVGVPILYLRAARDRVVPRAASALVARLNPRTRVVSLDAPHLLLQSVPSAAARVVAAFLREVAQAP